MKGVKIQLSNNDLKEVVKDLIKDGYSVELSTNGVGSKKPKKSIWEEQNNISGMGSLKDRDLY